MRRTDTRRKLERIVDTIDYNQNNLPLTPKQLYVFGSFIKGERTPNDLDLIFIHEPLDEKQRQKLLHSLSHNTSSPQQKTKKKLKLSNSEKVDILFGTSIEEIKKLMSGDVKKRLKDGFVFFDRLLDTERDLENSLYDDDFIEDDLINFFADFFEITRKHRKKRGFMWGIREEAKKWSTGLDEYVLVWDKNKGKIGLPECCK